MQRRSIRALVTVVLVAGAASGAHAATVTLDPVKDNTLYQDALGATSNGAGAHFFTGQVFSGDLRRGVIAFDIAGSLPSGADITGVTLTLYMSKTHASSGVTEISLHRAFRDWGEAASDAPQEEGEGAAALAGDATWLHAFYDTDFWETPGGEFAPVPSATQAVDAIGFYTWGSNEGMETDVQSWLDEPASNFGWAVVGDESGEPPTSKRFDTREEPIAGYRPQLTVEYTLGIPVVSTWGMIVSALLTLVAGAVLFGRARPAPATLRDAG